MATCTHCGAELKPGTKFCENCGAQVSAPQPPAPPRTPGTTCTPCTTRTSTGGTAGSPACRPASPGGQPLCQPQPIACRPGEPLRRQGSGTYTRRPVVCNQPAAVHAARCPRRRTAPAARRPARHPLRRCSPRRQSPAPPPADDPQADDFACHPGRVPADDHFHDDQRLDAHRQARPQGPQPRHMEDRPRHGQRLLDGSRLRLWQRLYH